MISTQNTKIIKIVENLDKHKELKQELKDALKAAGLEGGSA